MDRDLKQELGRAVAGVSVFGLLVAGLVVWRQFEPEVSQSVTGSQLTATSSATTALAVRGAVPSEYLGDEILPPRSAPAFDLLDSSGERLRLADLKGKSVLLSFAYTNCATVCPMVLGSFKRVERELDRREIKDVALVLITLDPDLDTPERLAEATEYVGGHWHFLTEDQAKLEPLWTAYGVVREKKDGVVNHTALAYLIDGHGLIRVRYGGTLQAKVMLNDIERLLANP